jgi:hypothetical protein
MPSSDLDIWGYLTFKAMKFTFLFILSEKTRMGRRTVCQSQTKLFKPFSFILIVLKLIEIPGNCHPICDSRESEIHYRSF